MAAIAIRVQEPVFESQTKTKLGSQNLGPEGPTMRTFVNDFIKKELDNYLHQNSESAGLLLKRILQSERERKEIAGIKKLANERAKKANLHNKKLRDCRVHLNDKKLAEERRNDSMIFITEGDSASGSITKTRDVQTQAVFSLRGKPFNCYAHTKKVVYENEEFNLLQHALNIEDGLEGLRYKKIPELVRNGHVFILDTPLFRIRNKKETFYCYDELERQTAIEKLGKNAEITRFKGLGEISPNEFAAFIGEDIRLEPVILRKETKIKDLLSFYMGKNTPDRQQFIIHKLRVEKDLIHEEKAIISEEYEIT